MAPVCMWPAKHPEHVLKQLVETALGTWFPRDDKSAIPAWWWIEGEGPQNPQEKGRRHVLELPTSGRRVAG